MPPNVLSGVSGLSDYWSPERRESHTRSVAQDLKAELLTYGQSHEGRALVAFKIPATAPTDRQVLCAANIHGVELIAGRVCLGLASALLRGGGLFTELLSQAHVWIAPCLNPDGYARTVEQGGVGKLSQLRTNARGVDLNRNFPLPTGAKPSLFPTAGSNHHGDATYRGLSPFSEPETQHLDTLLREQRFHAVLSLHSFMGTLIPACVRRHQEYQTYAALCSAFFARQERFQYRRLGSRQLDVFTGELEDHAHHVHGAWASCVESFPVHHSIRQHLRAPNLFWRFNPRAADDYVANDVPGLAGYFLEALARPRPAELR